MPDIDIKKIDAAFAENGFEDYCEVFASDEFKHYIEPIIQAETEFTKRVFAALNLPAPENLSDLSATWKRMNSGDVNELLDLLWSFAESRVSTKSKLNH